MTEEDAISKARHFAQRHGVSPGSILIAELLTSSSSVVLNYPDQFSPHIGSWWLVFKPTDAIFDGEERFFIRDSSEKIEWIGKPLWLRLILRMNHLLKSGRS